MNNLLNHVFLDAPSQNQGSFDLKFEGFSGDDHLFKLLFSEGLRQRFAEYSAVQLVSDILTVTDLGEDSVPLLLCELERYSSQDLHDFLNVVRRKHTPILVLSASNVKQLESLGVDGAEFISLVSLGNKNVNGFAENVRGGGNQVSFDLHSSQLRIDPSLLLPCPPACDIGSVLKQNSTRHAIAKKQSYFRRIRYPFAVTKRHLKHCLQELKTYQGRAGDEQGCSNPSAVSDTTPDNLQRYTWRKTGTVFLAVFESFDYGSDWPQLVTAFCSAMRDHSDATLVLWVTNKAEEQNKADLHHLLCSLAPIKCSVALVLGELTDLELYNLFSSVNILLNVQMYRSLRLDLFAAAACNIPVISPANSSISVFNHKLIYCCLETDEQLAAPDRSSTPVYSTRHIKVVWEDLHRHIARAYQLVNDEQAYKAVQAVQQKRFEQLIGELREGL